MTTPVILLKLIEGDPANLDNLNANFETLSAVINAMAEDTLLQFGAVPGAIDGYMPLIGGNFIGQISAPSILVGPAAGTKYPVVTTDDTATTGTAGLVEMAAAVADLNQTIAGPSIAEVQAISDKVDELLASLRAAGILAP